MRHEEELPPGVRESYLDLCRAFDCFVEVIAVVVHERHASIEAMVRQRLDSGGTMRAIFYMPPIGAVALEILDADGKPTEFYRIALNRMQ